MVLATVAGRFAGAAVFALPLLAFIAGIFTGVRRPYLWMFNNVVEVILYIVDGAFAVLPVLAEFGVFVPDDWAAPMSWGLLALPFVAMIPILCVNQQVFAQDDPTVLEKLSREEEQRREEIVRRRKEKRKKRRNRAKTSSDETKRTAQAPNPAEQAAEQEEMLFSDITANGIEMFDEDRVELHPGLLDPIRELRKRALLGHQDLRNPMWIDKRLLAKKATMMYEMVDRVIDGVTFESLYKVLKWATLAAGVAFGWFVGVLLVDQTKAQGVTRYVCG
jgi:hypothetical protein